MEGSGFPGNCALISFLVQKQGRVLLNFSSSLCFRQGLRVSRLSLGQVHFGNSGRAFMLGVILWPSVVGTGCLVALCGGTVLPCTSPYSPARVERLPPAQPLHPDRNTGGNRYSTPLLLHLSSAEGKRLQVLGAAKQAGFLQAPYLTLVKTSHLDGRALLRDFIGNLPPQRLLKQKLQSLTDIVNSKIFQSYGEKGHRVVLEALPTLSSPGGSGHRTGTSPCCRDPSFAPPCPGAALQKEAIPSSPCWSRALQSPSLGCSWCCWSEPLLLSETLPGCRGKYGLSEVQSA